MAFAAGDLVLFGASIIGTTLNGAQGDAHAPSIGYVKTAAANDNDVVWPNGTLQETLPDNTLRIVGAADSQYYPLLGARVQVTGKSVGFRGIVVTIFKVEVATLGNTGALTNVVVLLSSDGFYRIFAATDVEVVP